MVSKNNQYLKDTKQGTKVESYSIKKFKVGTASVVIGASIFFGAGAVSQAAEEVSNNTTVDNTTNAGEKAEAAPKAEAKPVVETTKENVAAAVAEKVGAETPKQETAKAEAKVNKEILKDSIASLEAKIKSAPDADKTAVDTAKEVLEKAKEQAKAEIEKIDVWGNRKLAYEIEDFTDGYYVLINFKAGVDVPKEIDRNLKISDAVIRHMIVNIED